MQGEHPEQLAPQPGRIYALTLDVGGADLDTSRNERGTPLDAPAQGEGTMTAVGRADLEIDLRPWRIPSSAHPATGWSPGRYGKAVRIARLYAELRALVEHWHARQWWWMRPGWVRGWLLSLKNISRAGDQFIFTAASKSQLGWDFLSAVETGRFKLFRAGESSAAGASEARVGGMPL